MHWARRQRKPEVEVRSMYVTSAHADERLVTPRLDHVLWPKDCRRLVGAVRHELTRRPLVERFLVGWHAIEVGEGWISLTVIGHVIVISATCARTSTATAISDAIDAIACIASSIARPP